MINQVWAADGKSWSKRIWENTEHLAATLNEKLIECVVGGKKTSDLKKALMERFGVSYNNADMLARTELAHIQTQAAKQRYTDTGIEYVEIWADKDERRCDVCGKLHKKRYPVDAVMPIPAHPRCRCCIVPVVDIPEEETIERPQPQAQTQPQQADTQSYRESNSVDEAQAYADKFVKTYKTKYNGVVSYNGLDAEHANSVNKALARVFDEYDIEVLNNIQTMNFREKQWKNAVESGTAAAYQWGNGGTLYINQKMLGNKKLVKAITAQADELLDTVIKGADVILSKPDLKDAQRNYINALIKTKRQLVAQSTSDFTEATIMHEMGHALHDKLFWKYQKGYRNPNGIDFGESMRKYGGNISGYAVSTPNEYIAESFAAYCYGERDKLDPEIVKMFEECKKKK
jgi:SPP1 gp7 family putative phage head morphogenesis protein